MQDTLTNIANRFFSNDPFYVNTWHRDRLWFHDVLHALLNLQPTSARNEEAVSIYQAVLLRSPLVTRRHIPFADGGQEITLSDINTIVIPGVKEFLNYLANRYGHRIKTALNEREIAGHYNSAVILSTLVLREFGQHLGQLPIDEIRRIPPSHLRNLVNIALPTYVV